MTVLPEFPDVEIVVMALLESVGSTVTRTGTDLESGTIRVVRTGGPDDGITDYPEVEIACFHADRTEAWRMQRRCAQLILASPNTYPGGVLVDSASTITGSQQIPDSNTGLADPVIATYQLSFRRPRNA